MALRQEARAWSVVTTAAAIKANPTAGIMVFSVAAGVTTSPSSWAVLAAVVHSSRLRCVTNMRTSVRTTASIASQASTGRKAR